MEDTKWSFEDLQAFLEEESAEQKRRDVTPDHWPPGIKPDTGKRAAWLPADWGQGFKESMNNNLHKVFISPEGKAFFNKRDIEKLLGKMLVDEPMKKDDRPLPPRRDWPEWLPTDWFISMKASSDRSRIYYISPIGKGFFNRAQAEDFMQRNPDMAQSMQTAQTSPSKSKPQPDAQTSPSKSKPQPEATSGKARPRSGRGTVSSPDSKGASATPDPGKKASEPTKDTAAKPEAQPAAAKSQAQPAAAKSEAPPADSAVGQQTSPTKRPRLDEAGTDDEVARIDSGLPGDGYAMCECRTGTSWLVLPDDVLSVDLRAISVEIETAGWTVSETAQHRCCLSGSPDLVLYESGKLLVRSGEAEEARRIAKHHVESWLLLDVPTESMQG